MSPEYQDHILISEGWVEDAAKNIRKGASAAASAGGAAIKGLKGEKISGSRNAVDRSLNSIGRTSHNVGTRFGRALTGAGATTSPKKAETKTQTPKQETKNDSTPAPKAEVKSTPSNSSTPSSSSSSNSGNKGKSGGRLDKALDWASDPKNKDAWMDKTRKEEYKSIADAYNSMYNGESLDEMDAAAWDKALEKAAAATQKRHKEQGYKVPGTNAMDDVIKRVMAKKKGKV